MLLLTSSTMKYEKGLICVTLSKAKGLLLPQREILRLRLRMTFLSKDRRNTSITSAGGKI